MIVLTVINKVNDLIVSKTYIHFLSTLSLASQSWLLMMFSVSSAETVFSSLKFVDICDSLLRAAFYTQRRRILPEKSGGGVWPASQNPNPIYDLTKNSIPYLWPLSLTKLL